MFLRTQIVIQTRFIVNQLNYRDEITIYLHNNLCRTLQQYSYLLPYYIAFCNIRMFSFPFVLNRLSCSVHSVRR